MKRFFILFLGLCFVCLPLSAQQDVRLTTYDGALVRSTNPLPVDASVTIGSITVSVFPVYADETGNPATATVDADNRVWVNLASDTIGLISAVEALGVSASETVLIAKLEEILNAAASETTLIAKLEEILNAEASDTLIISAVEALGANASETVIINELASISGDISRIEITNTTDIASLSGDISRIEATATSDAASISGDISRTETTLTGDIASLSGDIARSEAACVEAAKAAPTTIAQQTITLTPGVVTTITALSSRRGITLKAYSTNAESMWLSYDNVSTATAVLSGDELTPGGRISLCLPDTLTVGMIASTAETVYVCEQGD